MTPEEQAVREAHEQRTADLRSVMALPAGRRFLSRLLRNARSERPSYAGELTHATAYNEGVREMALALDGELQRVDFDLWLLMRSENRPSHENPHQAGDASVP